KPPGPRCPTFQSDIDALVNTVRTMAGVHVIHHRPPPTSERQNLSGITEPDLLRSQVEPRIVAIIASTGGPAALSDVLQDLPADFPLPIVIVQHIAADFMPSLVQHLASSSRLPVSIAQADEGPLGGHIYLAPGRAHLRLTSNGRFSLDRTQGLAQFMP